MNEKKQENAEAIVYLNLSLKELQTQRELQPLEPLYSFKIKLFLQNNKNFQKHQTILKSIAKYNDFEIILENHLNYLSTELSHNIDHPSLINVAHNALFISSERMFLDEFQRLEVIAAEV